MLEISLAFFVFHVSVYDKDLDPMITLNKRFKFYSVSLLANSRSLS